jgi:hypothetical protein
VSNKPHIFFIAALVQVQIGRRLARPAAVEIFVQAIEKKSTKLLAVMLVCSGKLRRKFGQRRFEKARRQMPENPPMSHFVFENTYRQPYR